MVEIDSYRFNFQYLISISGVTRILQVIFGLIVCGCAGVDICHSHDPTNPGCLAYNSHAAGQGYVLFVGSICIIFTTALFVALFLDLPNTRSTIPWRIIEIIYTGGGFALYLVASIIEAWYASGTGAGGFYKPRNGYAPWIVATVFGFFNTMLFAVQFFLLWMSSRSTSS